jgi:hypothetical protein
MKIQITLIVFISLFSVSTLAQPSPSLSQPLVEAPFDATGDELDDSLICWAGNQAVQAAERAENAAQRAWDAAYQGHNVLMAGWSSSGFRPTAEAAHATQAALDEVELAAHEAAQAAHEYREALQIATAAEMRVIATAANPLTDPALAAAQAAARETNMINAERPRDAVIRAEEKVKRALRTARASVLTATHGEVTAEMAREYDLETDDSDSSDESDSLSSDEADTDDLSLSDDSYSLADDEEMDSDGPLEERHPPIPLPLSPRMPSAIHAPSNFLSDVYSLVEDDQVMDSDDLVEESLTRVLRNFAPFFDGF